MRYFIKVTLNDYDKLTKAGYRNVFSKQVLKNYLSGSGNVYAVFDTDDKIHIGYCDEDYYIKTYSLKRKDIITTDEYLKKVFNIKNYNPLFTKLK